MKALERAIGEAIGKLEVTKSSFKSKKNKGGEGEFDQGYKGMKHGKGYFMSQYKAEEEKHNLRLVGGAF